MPIYDRSTKELMHDFAKAELKPGKVFAKQDAIKWFAAHYPKIKSVTVGIHVDGMSVNAIVRKHHKHIQPNRGWDLFIKLPNGQYRLWDNKSDPAPKYRDELINDEKLGSDPEPEEDDTDEMTSTGGAEFAYEQHLQQYLIRNISTVEHGLKVYEDEGISGVEFPVGGRYIDVLAVDAKGDFVVIELKVSRGYDRTIGQILRYMGWVQKNLAGDKRVRGIIVASDITDDLRLAASRIPDVKLLEYEISFSLKPVAP